MRLRVGDWRVIFDRQDAERLIDVLAVRPRGHAYQR
jgi:mRNA interferase RelE/StbE